MSAEAAVLEASEEVIEAVEKGAPVLARFVGNHTVHMVGALLVGAGAGTAVTYKVVSAKLKAHYEAVSEQEIEEARKFYRTLNKQGEDGEVLTPEQIMEERHGSEAPEEAAQALREYQGIEKVKAPEPKNYTEPEVKVHVHQDEEGTDVEVELENHNIFDETAWVDKKFDYDVEVPRRTNEAPYIITKEEFFNNESEYEQASLTYFENDDVLIDAQDMPVDDTDRIVGDDHLTMFGYGAEEPDVLYVRNDKMEMEFEIARNESSFSKMMGLVDDSFIEHSDSSRRGGRRFRHED